MIQNPDGNLHVYMLSVGQADTTVVVSPEGRTMVIDATRGAKIINLLNRLGNNGTLENLIITHPHSDHFSGGNRLAQDLRILEATVSPFWHEFGMGPPTYRRLVARLAAQQTNTVFLSGYSRWYPDGALTSPPPGVDPVVDADAPFLELLGPTNGMVARVEAANVFNTNHLSIITRLTWRNFRMLVTGDAQMENWQAFDEAGMLSQGCRVLRAAHHGSPNGTQWERVNRLEPREVFVSSDPGSGHHLPDLTATAIFTKFNNENGRMAVITRDSGTIHLQVRPNGSRTFRRFGDQPNQNVDLSAGQALTEATNPTDWAALLANRVAGL
jgi:beta-lactamase superfamily II metal-dependent hydrolase